MNLLIFDIDGTLTNTKLVDDLCFINAFQDQYKVMLANTDWTNFANVTDTGLYNDLYFSIRKTEPEKDEKTKFLNRFILYLTNQLQSSPEKFKEIPGAKDYDVPQS